MARANVYNQNKENKKSNKGLKITLISIVSLLVVAGIVVGTLFGLGYFNKNQEKKTYFDDKITLNDKEYDMSQFKYNASEIKNKIQDCENAFVFVYNNDTFSENNTLENYDNSLDEEILKLVKNLVVSVSDRNETTLMNLFIVDASIPGNEKIFGNENLGNLGESEVPALLYFHRGVYSEVVTDDLKDVAESAGLADITLSVKTNKKQLITTLKEVDEYIQKMYK